MSGLGGALALLRADAARWDDLYGVDYGVRWNFIRRREFRNLAYHRLRHSGRVGRAAAVALAVVFRPEMTLFLDTREIGPGFFIQHGFATIVAAERIGRNCWVNQQVTIGHEASGSPVLEDDVKVYAGAIVTGKLTMGAGSRAAAGAVVRTDVPADTTVGGVPARPVSPRPEH